MVDNTYSSSEGICPKCCRYGKWDGIKCGRCGYDIQLAKINPQLSGQILYFRNPVLYEPEQIYQSKDLVPDEPGVYGWYYNYSFENLFDEVSKPLFVQNRITVSSDNKEYSLMYIGIAGKTEKNRSLRDRIYDDHLIQNSEGSTVRQSLAALLYDKIGLDPRKQLNGEEERTKLNSWIFRYAKVAWITCEDPESVETELFKIYGKILPLNLKGNEKTNPCYTKLSDLRKNWRDKAQ